MKYVTTALVSAGLALSGCSTASKDIAPAYVSPIQYGSYDCEQISAENQRLTSRVGQLGGRLDEAAANDKAIGVAGALLFWPALFALGGTKGQEAEYSRLRGEHEALQQAAIHKKCDMTPRQATVVTTAAEAIKPSALSSQEISPASPEKP